jgi:hypothetical protein
MNLDTYVFNKVTEENRTIWKVTAVKDGKPITSYHTSRTKALNSLFSKNPRQSQFVVSLPKVMSHAEVEALFKK